MPRRPSASGKRKAASGDAEVARRLHSAALRLLRRLRASDAEAGLSPARLSVLSVLVFAGPRSVGALAKAEQVTQPTMSKLVAGLERERLVRTATDPQDRRSTLVEPTAAGTRILEKARGSREAALVELMSELDDGEVRTLAEAAEILLGLLE